MFGNVIFTFVIVINGGCDVQVRTNVDKCASEPWIFPFERKCFVIFSLGFRQWKSLHKKKRNELQDSMHLQHNYRSYQHDTVHTNMYNTTMGDTGIISGGHNTW